MNNLFQLRNKLSARILTQSQQQNTKGRGRDHMVRDFQLDFTPAVPLTPSTPSSPNAPTTPKGGTIIKIGKPGPGGPPQFGPGGPNSFGPII